MKRADPRDMRRNAAVMPGDVGMAEELPLPRRALDDPSPLVR